MRVTAAAIILIVLSRLSLVIKADWNHTILVKDISLNEGLKELLYNSTIIYISDGQHELQPGEETHLQYMTDIAFATVGTAATIQCLPNSGLSFAWSNRILIQNITLVGCNMKYWSTSRNYSSADNFQFMTVQASVYFLFCSDIVLNSITIRSSNNSRSGYGLVLYNTIGTNRISNSQFVSNGGYPLPIGGGVIIEFSYCIPGDTTSCPSKGPSLINTALVSNALYTLNNNIFNNNIASPAHFTNLVPYPTKGRDYFGFGRGGGLSCIFKGNAHNNTIYMSSNTFDNNIAQFGGSLYVAFDDNARDNRIVSHSDTIFGSKALIPSSSLTFVPPVAEGGGAMFLYGSEGNTISLQLATISNNTCSSFGGAISVKSMIATGMYESVSALILDQVQIEYNIAQQGAGIYFINIYPQSRPVIVNMSDCVWNYNSVEESCTSPSNIRCSGIVYTRMLPLVFSGTSTRFLMNRGSGLDIHQTTVTFYSQTITFTSNTADNGPAIHISNCGKVIVSHDINFFFGSNQAYFSGGAIYETGCTLTSLSYSGVGTSQCFIQYLDSSVHPDNWNTSFFFMNNIAGKIPNSIYTDSLLPCTWPVTNSSLLAQEDIKETFCWKRWIWSHDVYCQSVIQSGPAYINITTRVDQLYSSPGQPLFLPLKAYNNYDQEQYEEVSICVVSKFGSLHPNPSDAPDCITSWTSSPIPITLFSIPANYLKRCDEFEGQPVTVSIATINPPYPKILTPITFSRCPSSTHYSCPECYLSIKDNIGLKCVDTASCQLPQSPCTLNSSLTTTSGYCWNIEPNSSSLASLVGGNCPYSYGRTLSCASISDFISTLSSPNLCPGNRQGRLCGRCAPGYGLTTDTIDFRCIKCYGLGWPLQLVLQIVAITVLIVVILTLSISLNAGGTNAFIFFAQVVTIRYPGVSYPSWIFEPDITSLQYNSTIVRGFTMLYSIANFDVITPLPLPPFCLSEHFTPLQAILLDFIPAFYPLLLLVILYSWIAMYSYKFKPVYVITMRMSILCRCRKIKYKPSLLDGFATIAIICFSLITATCFKLLTPTSYYSMSGDRIGTAFYYDGTLNYFGSGHIEYAIISLAILLIVVLVPSTLLTFSSCITRWFSKRQVNMTRINALAGTFNSCFKDGREGGMDLRFFAGVYLYLRIVVRLIYMFHDTNLLLALETVLSIIVAVVLIAIRPYKNDIYNIIDAIIFLYLALMAGISAAGYAYLCYKGLLYLPLLFVIVYGIYAIAKLCKNRFHMSKQKPGYTLVSIAAEDDLSSDEEEDVPALMMARPPSNDSHNTEEMFVNRLLHPEQYTRMPS